MSTDSKAVLWPGWETVRLIGRGSFGAVYEIQRDIFGEIEKAALKVISIPQNASDIDDLYNDGYDDESITSTFQSHLKSIVAEYSLMRRMNGCSNIVNCDDIRYVQHEDGIGWDIFIKMELLTPLAKTLTADIPEAMVIQVATDLCYALELCRKHNIIHRDIKPQNIFVSPNGDYKLGDFGIAKTVEKTMGGTKIGTYKYMAPEVYSNQPYGAAADIYSLGLVLYWMLNERRMPFLPLPPAKLSTTMEEQARFRRFSGEPLPPPAHGSKELKQIVLKACAFDPKERYDSAAEMKFVLERLVFQGTPAFYQKDATVAPPVQKKKSESILHNVSEPSVKDPNKLTASPTVSRTNAENNTPNSDWRRSEAVHRQWVKQQQTEQQTAAYRSLDNQNKETEEALARSRELRNMAAAHKHWSKPQQEETKEATTTQVPPIDQEESWRKSEAAHREWMKSKQQMEDSLSRYESHFSSKWF